MKSTETGKTALYSTLECQSPVDLVILMLGTNDLKPRFSLNAFDIAAGAERLIRIIRTHLPDGQKQPPRILLVCPPPIGDQVDSGAIGGMFTAAHSVAESRALPRYFAPAGPAVRLPVLSGGGLCDSTQPGGQRPPDR